MATNSPRAIHFGPFEVTKQVFLTTPHSFALVNLKPLLPGHVLVCTLRPHKRLTSLSQPEVTDLFQTVQRVQLMLARHFFKHAADGTSAPEDGSFNIALQDGVESGQTVPHVHVHVIPRIREKTAKDPNGEGDVLYERMAREEGNVGGALWDEALGRRPTAGGGFPLIEDATRSARGLEDMMAEVEIYKAVLTEMDRDGPPVGE